VIADKPMIADKTVNSLEAEAIHIFREVAAEAENPVFLYSVGKNSADCRKSRRSGCR